MNLNDKSHPPYRNTIRKLIFDALVNKEDLQGMV
jgi:hypothetical protein